MLLGNRIKLSLIISFLAIANCVFPQMSYYQDQFAGGVTGAGYSPAYSQTAPITGVITVNIAPGSTIRNAYLIAGRLGNAPATTVLLNGTPLTFNATNQASGTFNTIYGGASAVHIINVTSVVSPAVNVYNLSLPAQASTSNRYQDYYLYIAYDNPTLASVATAIFINNQNAANLMNWGTLNFVYPFNTLAGDIGYSFFGGYECSAGDGEKLILNGTNLGTVWGQDINSGLCGGPVGSFYYRNATLTALSDDNVNQAVNGPEALSNIVALVTNNSNTLTLAHQHASATSTDNHPWGAIFAYPSCQNPTITAVSSPTSICPGNSVVLTAGGAATYTWSPGSIVGSTANVTPTVTTTYTVSGKNLAGCIGTQTVLVTVNPLPTVNIVANPAAICVGNSSTLTASGAQTYTWSPGGMTGTNVTVNPAATTIYTVTGSSTAGCINTNTLSLTVNALPVVNPGSNSPVCVGGTLNLNVTAASTYTWSGPSAFTSAVQNPSIPNVNAANAGVYTVSVTNASGCVNSNTVNVAISSLPVITPANTGPYCVGSTISLSVSAAATYTWSGPNAFSSNVQNPTIPNSQLAHAGTYSVTVANAGGCLSSGTTSVTVNALPTPTALSNSPVCENSPINFTGLGGVTYTWSGPGGYSSTQQNPSIAVSSLTNAGTSTLTVTDANGCINFTTVALVVNPLPVIVVNNPTVCLNQTINLTSTGGSTYAWSGPLAYSSNNQNPSIANAALNMTGVYTVTVTTAANCSNTAVSNVQVLPLPNPQIVSNSPVCENGTLNLNGSGGAQYAWVGPNAFNSLQQNPSINPVTLAANGVYTLLVSSGTCTASTTATVIVNALPTPQIVSNSPVCVGQAINFTGSGGTTYAWSGPGFISPTQNPTIAISSLGNNGTFTLTVTDANNCTNSTTQNVIVNALPNVNATGATVCENFNANLNASGGVTYSWSGPGGFNSNNQNPSISNAQLTASGQYTVTVTDANTCTNTAVATVVVNPAPVANIITNSPICVNTSLSLAGSGGVNYAWSGPNGFNSVLQNPNFTATSTNFAGNYNLTVTDANGCSASTSTNVTINPIPNISISSSANVGCAPLCVTFNANSSSNIQTYNWNLGNGTTGNTSSQQTCYGTTGIYTISVGASDEIGCSNSATYTVQVYPQPIADFNYAPIKPIINIDDQVVFTDASHGDSITAWNWYFMNTAQYTSNLQNPTFMYTEPGTYAVALVVKSDKGCTDTIVRSIVVGEDFGIYVPNAFTPNGDGLNDIFQPKGFGIVKYELQIFDRWGERIFATKSFDHGWDGKVHKGVDYGIICEEGVYTWLINVTNVFGKSQELKGHVTLIK